MQRNAHILLNAQLEKVLQPASLYHPHPSGDKSCASLCQPPEFLYALFITLTNSSYGLTAWTCYATHTQEFF